MPTTKSMTWVHAGGESAPKEVVSFGAGEDVVLSFAPGAATTGTNKDLTGRSLQIVIADTQSDPAVVNLFGADITVTSVVNGLFTAALASIDTLGLPTGVYKGEVRSIESGGNAILRRFHADITANPLASGESSEYPPATVAWSQITATPTTLAGYGIALAAITPTTVNGLTITTTTGTLTLAAAKTLTVNNTLTFTGTDGSTLAIGTGGTLTALAALTIAANSLTIGTAADTFSQTAFAANTFPARASTGNLVAKPVSDFALTILDDADSAAVRTTIGAGTSSFSGAFSALSGIPTTLAGYGIADAQPLDATLAALAALTIAANSLTIGTGADAFAQTAFAENTFPARSSTGSLVAKNITDFGLSLVDAADASAARSTLGLVAVASSGSAADLSAGTLPTARMPALTGHVTTSVGAVATTIAAGVVTEAMQALADNTTADVSITKHGYAPKAPNDDAKYLNGVGAWTIPSTATAAASTLTGTTLAANVLASSLTSFGNSPTLVTPSATTSITTPKIIGGTSTTQTLTYQTTTGVGAAGADHVFLVGNNGDTQAMRIRNSGAVRIATPNSGAASATAESSVYINDNNTDGPNMRGGLEFNIFTAGGVEGYGAKLYTNSSGALFGIATRHQSLTWTSRFTVNILTGFVGINGDPGARLQVTAGSAGTIAQIIKLAATPSAHALDVNSSSGSDGDLAYISQTGGAFFAGVSGLGTAPVATSHATFGATTSAKSSFNLPTGTSPTSPVDGDVWREDNTNTGLKIRVNGVTKTITLL